MRLLLALFAALFVSLSARAAFAQATIAVANEASLPRLDKNGSVIGKRPSNQMPEGVSLQDCIDDQRIRFTLQLAGFDLTGHYEVWASTVGDCNASTTRSTSSGLSTCWKLGANPALTAVQNYDIPVRTIMAGVGHPTTPTDPTSTAVCGAVDLTTIVVHIIYFAPGSTEGTGEHPVSITVDTVGPDPPPGITTLPGNQRIRVQWTDTATSDDSGTTTTTGAVQRSGVNVYCDPNISQNATRQVQVDASCTDVPNEAGIVEAGIDDSGDATFTEIDAGSTQVCTDGGTTTETIPGCTSAAFTGDGGKVFPDKAFAAQYLCGSTSSSSGTSIDTDKPLENGKTYAVAIAITDAFGNAGSLSSPICNNPAETTDFWENYRNAGGQAGGGCSTSGSDVPLGTMTAAFAAIATLLHRRKKQGR